MGGTIVVGVRHSDGSEHVFETWTNIIPWWMTDPRMMEEGEELRKFERPEEEIEHYPRDLGKIDAHRTYGLILLDYKNKQILSRNDYCSVPRMLVHFHDGRDAYLDSGTAEHLCLMHAAGRLKIIQRPRHKDEGEVWNADQLTALIAVLKGHQNGVLPNKENYTFEAWLDWSPWTIDSRGNSPRWYEDTLAFTQRNGWTSPVTPPPPDDED